MTSPDDFYQLPEWTRCDFCLPGRAKVKTPGGAAICINCIEKFCALSGTFPGEHSGMNTLKIRLYLDVAPWMVNSSWQFAAYANPVGVKLEGSKRYIIEVEVPDPREPDATLPATVKEET